MPRMLRHQLLGSLFLLASAACERESGLAWCDGDDPGADVVIAAEPARWRQPPQFEELWRAGGLQDNETLVVPVGITVARSGQAAVPDFGLGEVIVVGSDGSWDGAWSRKGQGPGEVQVPIAAAWTSDGRLAVWDVGNSKVAFFRDGAPVEADLPVDPMVSGAIAASGEVLWADLQADGTVYTKLRRVGSGESPEGQAETIIRSGPGESVPDTLARLDVRMLPPPFQSFYVPGSRGLLAAASDAGPLAVADDPERYRVALRGADAEERVICRDVPAIPLSPAERGTGADDEMQEMAAALAAAPAAAPQPFGRLFFDADERLWVQRNRPDPLDSWDGLYGVAGARYDVYSPDGQFLGEVTAPPRARLQSARGDTVWALEIGELDEPSIVAYRIQPE